MGKPQLTSTSTSKIIDDDLLHNKQKCYGNGSWNIRNKSS